MWPASPAIVRHPNSEIVDVSYNQVVPRKIEGSLDDPGIRQLLMLASEDSASPGVRDDSVALLAAECRAGHSCQPSGIRDALMYALRNDRSPKVRQKALQGLEPYVADDVRVRDAVLEAVLNDSDPGDPHRRNRFAWSPLTPIPAFSRFSIQSRILTRIPRSGMFPGRF